MLIESKGIKTDTFYIPPFDLNEGEIVVLYLFNGQHFYETEMFLKDIFCGKTNDENVLVHKNLTFVEHFIESKLRRLFYPVTVGEYLEKKVLYEITWFTIFVLKSDGFYRPNNRVITNRPPFYS